MPKPQLILDIAGVIVTNLSPTFWEEAASASGIPYTTPARAMGWGYDAGGPGRNLDRSSVSVAFGSTKEVTIAWR